MTVPVNASAVGEMKSNGVMRQRGFLLDSITFSCQNYWNSTETNRSHKIQEKISIENYTEKMIPYLSMQQKPLCHQLWNFIPWTNALYPQILNGSEGFGPLFFNLQHMFWWLILGKSKMQCLISVGGWAISYPQSPSQVFVSWKPLCSWQVLDMKVTFLAQIAQRLMSPNRQTR